MKRKIAIIITAISAIIAIGVGSTLAYFTATSGPVINTFTVGKVELTLTETTGERYPMIPGTTIAKNPRVTVKGGSEDCWLFIKVEKDPTLDTYISYHMADGWTPLPEHNGVYYRQVPKADSATVFSLLRDDSISVKNTVDKTVMAAIASPPKLSFTAYAIQNLGIDTAALAWSELQASIQE